MPFFREVILSFPHGPGFVVSLAPIDINRDGRLDLVLAWSGNAYLDSNGNLVGTRDPIAVLINIDGESFVDSSNTIFQGSVPTTLIASRSFTGDFNGDGFQDLYIPDHGPEGGSWPGGPGTLLFSGSGGGLTSAPGFLTGFSTVNSSLAVGDIDGDNDDDVILTIAGGPTHLHVYVSDPAAGMSVQDNRLPFVTYDIFAPGNPYGFPSSICSALVDVDGDGDLDLVLPTSHPGNLANPSLLLFNDGTGHFGYGPNDSSKLPFVLANQNDTITDIKHGDIDGDGDQDFIVTCLNANAYNEGAVVAVYSNNGLGVFTISSSFRSNSTGVELIDLNNDGYFDIICADDLVRSFFLNDGAGNFIAIADPTQQAGRLVRLSGIDLNSDGRTDLIAWSFDNNQVTIWFGKDQPDVQTGDSLANDLLGDSGNDTLTGLGGDDVLFGSSGVDLLDGGDGDDYLNGGVGNDQLLGGNGNDQLVSGGGIDVISGGAGNDRLILASAANGSSIDGGAGTDTLSVAGNVSLAALVEIEAIELSSNANLTLTGVQFANGLAINTLISGTGGLTVNLIPGTYFFATQMTVAATVTLTVNGTSGSDVIKGPGNAAMTVMAGDGADQIRTGSLADMIDAGAGADKIMGLGGADVLTGGAGADQFRYLFTSDSTLAAQDRILDFTNGEDKLDFRTLDANPLVAGRQALSYIGTSAFAVNGTAQVRYADGGADTLVQIDLNGDGAADMQIVLVGHAGQPLAGTDFLL